MTGFRDLHVGRLALPTVLEPTTEALGSNLTVVGDATAVGQRKAKGFTLVWPIHGTPGDPDLRAAGQAMRRQLRSLMQNHPLRLAGVYVNFSIDPERNGWLVIGQAELADTPGASSFGEYQLSLSEAYLVASRFTHREGYRVDITDRRLVTAPVDYFGEVINTAAWFSTATPVSVTYLPVGVSDVNVRGTPVTTSTRTGSDGAVPFVTGLGAGDVVAFERAETDFNKGDVVLYDRRGSTIVPTAS